jgi:hypothetical protein
MPGVLEDGFGLSREAISPSMDLCTADRHLKSLAGSAKKANTLSGGRLIMMVRCAAGIVALPQLADV